MASLLARTIPLMNFKSRGHCESQYPVPYLAPAVLVEYLAMPPSASMETKYSAPLRPHYDACLAHTLIKKP